MCFPHNLRQKIRATLNTTLNSFNFHEQIPCRGLAQLPYTLTRAIGRNGCHGHASRGRCSTGTETQRCRVSQEGEPLDVIVDVLVLILKPFISARCGERCAVSLQKRNNTALISRSNSWFNVLSCFLLPLIVWRRGLFSCAATLAGWMRVSVRKEELPDIR